MQKGIVATGLAALAALAALAFQARGGFGGEGLRYALGALTGGLAGIGLYHASFGFTGAWRRLTRERRGAGVRAQMVLFALTCTITYLLIGYQDVTGWKMYPVIMPMGVVSALGAFMFGIGMQIGGGCASGTLFTAGGGSSRMMIVLFFFVLGSVWATADIPGFWREVPAMTGIPNIPGTSLIRSFGPIGALAALYGFCAVAALVSAGVERRAHGALEPRRRTGSLLTGPWSLVLGAVVLAAVGTLSFLIFARPWSVTAGFALWGAKLLAFAGVPVADWPYWSGWRAGPLAGSVFADRVSLMNFGIIAGAMLAAGLAGKFRPTLALSTRDVLTAIVGGLLMGYGARLAYGCNIGALLGGVVSGSLHGWWWLVWGFLGSIAGTRLRRVLEMDPPLAPAGQARSA